MRDAQRSHAVRRPLAHGEALDQVCFIVDLYQQLGVRQVAVVISAQDMHVQRRVAFAPCQPLLVTRRDASMQDVAQDPQLAACIPVQQRLQAVRSSRCHHWGARLARRIRRPPKCRSAINSACRVGQYSALAKLKAIRRAQRKQFIGHGGAPAAWPLHAGTPVLVAELPRRRSAHSRKPRGVSDAGHCTDSACVPICQYLPQARQVRLSQHFAFGQRQQQMVGSCSRSTSKSRPADACNCRSDRGMPPGEAGYQQAGVRCRGTGAAPARPGSLRHDHPAAIGVNNARHCAASRSIAWAGASTRPWSFTA